MYYNWLDKWDERRARRSDDVKSKDNFVFDAELGFSVAKGANNIAEFIKLADKVVADPTFFDDPNESLSGFEKTDGWIKFPSGITTSVEENNKVWAKVTESDTLDKVIVVFHHWNASKRNRKIANFFSKRGVTVVEIAMPYHFERSRPSSTHSDYILSPNLGRTIQSMRQAVWDGRKLIRYLKAEGYGEVSVLGMSLGSWVAGLIAAHEPSVRKASLFLTAGSFADFVWTGRATKKIRESLEDEINLSELRKAWGPLNLENYVNRFARADLDLHIVLAKRDTVVLPEISKQFLEKLKNSGKKASILELNCGHYSLALPPSIIFAGWGLKQLLQRSD